ncbi:MAG TPA: hypothetical protein VE779_01940 [Candidatus Angelobacter sp.]|nr:hypothetical protein [Candidatus Angelobacter sp.]
MTGPFALLLVCNIAEADSPFHKSLQAAGFRLVSVRSLEDALALPPYELVDGILVCQEHVRVGVLGLKLKALFCDVPVVLLSTAAEAVPPPYGIDGVCYTNSFDDEAARLMEWLFHEELNEPSYPPNRVLKPADAGHRQFASMLSPE